MVESRQLWSKLLKRSRFRHTVINSQTPDLRQQGAADTDQNKANSSRPSFGRLFQNGVTYTTFKAVHPHLQFMKGRFRRQVPNSPNGCY